MMNSLEINNEKEDKFEYFKQSTFKQSSKSITKNKILYKANKFHRSIDNIESQKKTLHVVNQFQNQTS